MVWLMPKPVQFSEAPESTTAEKPADEPPAEKPVKKQARKKPGPKPGAKKKAAAKKSPGKKKAESGPKPSGPSAPKRRSRVKANNQRDIRPEENGAVHTSSMNQPKRGYTEAEALEMLRVGYSVERIAQRTGYAERWLTRQTIPSTPLLERIGKK